MSAALRTFLILVSIHFSAVLSTQSMASEYVGSEQCVTCHEQKTKAWRGSHHDMSMRHADAESVLGDFDDTVIDGKNRFYKKGEQYWVTIKGPEGKYNDYQIKYTFGFKPLQQYMVEFTDGRVQLIPFAWDSRDKATGGQRWFNLYPQFNEKHQEFFWTNTGQNWNYMCADCHSTNVSKNYDLKSDTYSTTFSEINVGCEACHGPASEHVKQIISPPPQAPKFSGFERDISKQVSNWVLKQGKTTLMPETIEPTQQTTVCGQCHSRHTQISNNDAVQANDLSDRYLLSSINGNLYYPDGQIYDEVFVYGSFLQSKMYKNGVVCSNCHDPHTAQLSIPKEAVCLQCHLPETYANKDHHNHQQNSTGAQCVNCHMPETTYMEVDQRADHGWHIPRPDLSKQLNTPDACLNCHQEKDSNWSADIVKTWFPQSAITSSNHFAPVFFAADRQYQDMGDKLSHLSQDKSNANIIRAAALERIEPYPSTNTLIAVARGTKDPDSLIRVAAITGSQQLQSNEKWQVISPLLSDDVLAVRTEAARSLAIIWQELSANQQKQLTPNLTEYITSQQFNADRGFAHNNIANIYIYQEKFKQAEQAYQQGIRVEPYYQNSYLNLADLYRRQQQNQKSIDVLLQALDVIPDDPEITYAIGLAYIRNKQAELATKYFYKATQLLPSNAQYHYVYALSIETNSPNKAQSAMNKAYRLSNNPQYLFSLCEMQIKYKSFAAKQCINELSNFAPKDVIIELTNRLEGSK